MALKKLGYGPRLSGAGTVCKHSNLVRLCNEEGEARMILECLTCKAQFQYSDLVEKAVMQQLSGSLPDTVAPEGQHYTTLT